MDDLGIDTRPAGGQLIMVVEGEIDMATVPQLQAALEQAQGDVVIDLSAVPFLDSSGLHVLSRSWAQRREAGHTLSVRGANTIVSRTIEIAGLQRLLTPQE